MRFSTGIAASTLAATASAELYYGFNSGSLKDDDSAKFKSDFVSEMTTAQNLDGAPVTFNAVRLYTNIQAYSTADPIEAFEAAVETDTKLLLGIWTSGTTSIDNEMTALKAGLDKYGSKLADLIVGMSIGSEDLYRNSATGVANSAGVGADPDVIVNFIKEFKSEFADSLIANVPIGHVDTWDVWPNATNKAVIDAVDWIGLDEYPYYESGKGNNITNSGSLFDTAFDAAVAAIGDKPVWVTETGWPYVGETWDEAEASVANAKYFWDEVGCRKLFGQVNTFWYNLRDSNSANSMKFAITDNLSTSPRFNLTCPTTFDTPTPLLQPLPPRLLAPLPPACRPFPQSSPSSPPWLGCRLRPFGT
ncbi:glycoside hydrolase superfamily [Truncatella angustata]|uniref:Glycoside hydrolase superfamily n=1 Tax=Truncatella angustata TaxID=152316 RepID=A0A9P8RI25_9PEZI|nr:glycoside hydrolase superfamily [Truncatella angustata]KAH6643312.1 glycoside hydrolase superfamily [Truncatella angustata]